MQVRKGSENFENKPELSVAPRCGLLEYNDEAEVDLYVKISVFKIPLELTVRLHFTSIPYSKGGVYFRN